MEEVKRELTGKDEFKYENIPTECFSWIPHVSQDTDAVIQMDNFQPYCSTKW